MNSVVNVVVHQKCVEPEYENFDFLCSPHSSSSGGIWENLWGYIDQPCQLQNILLFSICFHIFMLVDYCIL